MMHEDNDSDDENELTNDKNNDTGHNHDDDDDLKNRCFNIFPSILRKQYSKYKTNCRVGKKHYSFSELDDSNATTSFPITDKCLIPGSPISPRVKNFNLDMKILVLSRHDNPYLSKQLERSSSLTETMTDFDHDEYFNEPATPIFSRRNRSTRSCGSGSSRSHAFRGSSFMLPNNNPLQKVEDGKNLHEQLVRSPPPHFPEKLSHFLFNDNLIAQVHNDDQSPPSYG